MNWMTRSLPGLVCLALVGCAAGTTSLDTQRRLAAVDTNEFLAPQVRNAILEGRLLLGMSEEMVAASWGLPRHVSVSHRDGQARGVWEYGARQGWGWETVLVFEGGTLTRMERSRTRGGPDMWGEFTTREAGFEPRIDLDRDRLYRGMQP